MPYPKKINSQNLVDSIVELQFDSDVPNDLFVGMSFKKMEGLGFKISEQKVADRYLYIKGDLRVQFIANVISFNCIKGKYIGWESYSSNILTVIDVLLSSGMVTTFNQAVLRYVTEFENSEFLKNGIASNFQFSTPENENYRIARITMNREQGNYNCSINIYNNVNREQRDANGSLLSSISNVSLIEITAVTHFIEKINSVESIKIILDGIHAFEKKNFFELLSEPFLNALNPEY